MAAPYEVELTKWRPADAPDMDEAETAADRGVGYTVGLGLVAVVGAFLTYANPGSPVAGYGFAIAMVAASLAVVAAQLY